MYVKNKKGNLIFNGGEIGEVVLMDLISTVSVEFPTFRDDEIVVFRGYDSEKLIIRPRPYHCDNLPNGVQAILTRFVTIGQIKAQANKFPGANFRKTIIFYGIYGELRLLMEK